MPQNKKKKKGGLTMIWRTDKPTEDVIVAKLIEAWQGRYELLYLADEPYKHYYDVNGDEVPRGAIAKWASLKDEEGAMAKLQDERVDDLVNMM